MDYVNALLGKGAAPAPVPAPVPAPAPPVSSNARLNNENYTMSRRTRRARRMSKNPSLYRTRSAPNLRPPSSVVTVPYANDAPPPSKTVLDNVAAPGPLPSTVSESGTEAKPVTKPETASVVESITQFMTASVTPPVAPTESVTPTESVVESADLPKVTVDATAGFDQLNVTLSGQQSIYVKAGMQMQMDDSLELKATLGNQGVLGAVYRGMSTGTVVQNHITVKDATGSGTVSIFSFLPGNVHELTVTGEEEWAIHDACYVASTANILVESKLTLRGGITSNGLFKTVVRLRDGEKGPSKVWLFAYGGVRTKKNDVPFRLHAGLFLAAKEKVYTESARLALATPHLGSALFSGLGIMLWFDGKQPDEVVYLQSGNLDALRDFIEETAQVEDIKGDIKGDMMEMALDKVFE